MYKEERTFNVLEGTIPNFKNCLTLGGATPVIKEGLIPVIINETDETVTKINAQSKDWYNYCEKRWANAVILVDGAKEYKEGETIPEDQIESYFVWIPKYKYKIFDMGNTYTTVQGEGTDLPNKAQIIEIQFGTIDTSNENSGECTTPETSGGNGECKVGDWMTHPAFTAFPNSKGLWVGKFETGYNQNDDTSKVTLNSNWTMNGAQHNEKAPTKVIIKPNVYSWRSITVGNAFNTSYNYERELDSHMMKNTEWGAVAYLSHSKYGTCTNNFCTEVRNNNSNYVTGYAAIEISQTGYPIYKDFGIVKPGEDAKESSEFKGSYNYINKESGVASTTGNNTGIFDMSGGTWEYVMGYTSLGDLSKSELTIENDLTEKKSKYFDTYLSTNNSQYDKRILGDATGEMGSFFQVTYGNQTRKISSWHNDEAWFATSNSPWFNRGGDYQTGIGAGIFAFGPNAGNALSSLGFRIALTPTNDIL